MTRTFPTNITTMRVVCLICLAAVGVLSSPASGADDDTRFQLTITPYIWLPGVSGTVQTGPVTSSPDLCFTQLFDDATCLFGAFGRVEGWYDRIGFYVDGGWTGLKFQETAPLGTTRDLDFDLAIVDFGLLLNLADWHLGESNSSSDLKLDAYAGGRLMYVSAEVELEFLPTETASESWVDPIVGARMTWDIDRHWSIIAGGDVGGFGAASDFCWEAAAYVAYKFPIGSKVESALLLGYKAIGDDYSTGSGLDRFEWDVVLHGPVIGFAMQF